MTLNNLEQGHLKNIFSYLDKQDTLNFRSTNNKAIVKASKDKVTIYSKNHAKTQDKINLIHNNNIDLNHEETLDIIKQDNLPVTISLIENQNRELNSDAILEIPTRAAMRAEQQFALAREAMGGITPTVEIIPNLPPVLERQFHIDQQPPLPRRFILTRAETINNHVNQKLLEHRRTELNDNPQAIDKVIEYANDSLIVNMFRSRVPISQGKLGEIFDNRNSLTLVTMINEHYLDNQDHRNLFNISDNDISDKIMAYRHGIFASEIARDPAAADALQTAFNEMVRRRTRATERNQRT